MVFQPFCDFRSFPPGGSNTQRKLFQFSILCRKSNAILSQEEDCAGNPCTLPSTEETVLAPLFSLIRVSEHYLSCISARVRVLRLDLDNPFRNVARSPAMDIRSS